CPDAVAATPIRNVRIRNTLRRARRCGPEAQPDWGPRGHELRTGRDMIPLPLGLPPSGAYGPRLYHLAHEAVDPPARETSPSFSGIRFRPLLWRNVGTEGDCSYSDCQWCQEEKMVCSRLEQQPGSPGRVRPPVADAPGSPTDHYSRNNSAS